MLPAGCPQGAYGNKIVRSGVARLLLPAAGSDGIVAHLRETGSTLIGGERAMTGIVEQGCDLDPRTR
jgi:hypothetical protein